MRIKRSIALVATATLLVCTAGVTQAGAERRSQWLSPADVARTMKAAVNNSVQRRKLEVNGTGEDFVRYAPTSIPSDCSVDVTGRLNNWIRGVPDNSALALRANGCYRIDGTVELVDRNRLWIDGRGATLRAFTDSSDTWRSQFRVIGGYKISIKNVTIQGANPTPGQFSNSRQHQHSVDLSGVNTVTVEDVNMVNPGGNCVYVGRRWEAPNNWSKNVDVRSSNCTGSGRHGFGAPGADGVKVRYSTFSNIGRTVMNLEPEGSGYGSRNIELTDNTASGPFPGNFVSLLGSGPVQRITIARNQVLGTGIYIGILPRQAGTHSQIKIVDNASDTGYSSPGSAAIDVLRTSNLEVRSNDIPLAGENMALVKAGKSCQVTVRDNNFPGGVAESRVTEASC